MGSWAIDKAICARYRGSFHLCNQGRRNIGKSDEDRDRYQIADQERDATLAVAPHILAELAL